MADHVTPAKLEAFVTIVEEQGFSRAARRLHIGQPTLSQTVSALEHRFGVKLLERSNGGARPTRAGQALFGQARAVLARHDELLRTMASFAAENDGDLRVGLPTELAPNLLCAFAQYCADHPHTRTHPRHLPMAAQLACLRTGELDVSFTNERPHGPGFDAMLVAREKLGVLLAKEVSAKIAGADGIRIGSLTGLSWVGFARRHSPAWYDSLVALLRSYGIDVDAGEGSDQLHHSVVLATVTSRPAFALTSPSWGHPLPDAIAWHPIVGDPVVRHTWAVWPAGCRRREVSRLIATLEAPDGV